MSTTIKPLAAAPPAGQRLDSLLIAGDDVCIPGWVVDLPSFRRWSLSDEFPQRGRIDYLNGRLWVDMVMEEFFWHNQVKTEITIVLGSLVKAGQLGRFVGDRMRLVNSRTGLSCEPDGAFANWETLRSGRIRLTPGANAGFMELDGTPDMVLEVVSASSVRKDTQELPITYHQAEIPEYWLIDARIEPVKFDLFWHTPTGYAANKSPDGWSRSAVFSKEFRLIRTSDPLGQPQFTLEMRDPRT